MTLRAKLIVLFAALGVTPIVALGVFNYLRTIAAVEDLIATRTDAIAQRVAAEVSENYQLRQSDLLLLAENAETQRLCRARAGGTPEELENARAEADRYLRRAWDVVGPSYRWVEFHDADGALLYGLSTDEFGRASERRSDERPAQDVITVRQPIRDTETSATLGSLTAAVRLRALLPEEALSLSFGNDGYSVVLDRAAERTLFHPRRAFLGQDVLQLLGPEGWNVDPAGLADGSGHFRYEEENTSRIASFSSLTDPPWTVLTTASLDEFAGPFARHRLLNLSLMALVAALVSTAFLLVTHRMTRSLGALTLAADQVAAGDFSPELPPPGTDEVGKLAATFGLMVNQVQAMVRRIEESRHMAAVGKFASQLSHEIRNPLTSIKLNLQTLERGAQRGELAEGLTRPVEISLREVSRLDRVLRGVLGVARNAEPVREPCSVHAAIEEALDTLHPQLEAQGIVVMAELRATADTVRGDPQRLRGALLNLFLNAVEAMPSGGRLEVMTENTAPGQTDGSVRVQVVDTGPGIRPELRERIFEPFFTTKDEGTGFGLALASQAIEEHDGSLSLADNEGCAGAVFLVELPATTTRDIA
jgi:signal transduction histidine kinase